MNHDLFQLGLTPPLHYHQAALDLVGETPHFLTNANALIEQVEQSHHISLPPSVREWYSLNKGSILLSEYSNDDHIVPLEDLGEYGWRNKASHPLAQGLLPFMLENQAACTWAIHLTGADDPPVLVSYDEKETLWLPFASSFSLCVYTRIWDFRRHRAEYVLWSNEGPLQDHDLQFLREHFKEGPLTFSYPGEINYRFWQEDRELLLWSSETESNWWLRADTEEDLERLVRSLWHCGTLRDTLQEWNLGGEILTRLHAE